MPVVDKAKEPEAKYKKDTFNPKNTNGFHVLREDGEYLGTYDDKASAQAFIDGHVTPQDIKASIVEGHEVEETE